MTDTIQTESLTSTSSESPTTTTTTVVKSSHSSLLNSDATNAGESDADSGIVAAGNGKRGGSTSSNSDEDQSGNDLSPTLSSSVPETKKLQFLHRVRFDDELEMSEQNMRRSCRKLFAALYPNAQTQTQTQTQTLPRNGYHINNNHQPIIVEQIHTQSQSCHQQNSQHFFTNVRNGCNANYNYSLLPTCHCQQFSQTLPRQKPRDYSDDWPPINSHLANLNIEQNICQNHNYHPHHQQQLQHQQQFSDLLLQTVSQAQEKESLQSQQEDEIKQMKLLDPSRFKSKSCWSINQDFTTNCAALESIRTMSDPFESASLVHAFAKPIIINANDSKIYAKLHDESLYETIYPKNDKDQIFYRNINCKNNNVNNDNNTKNNNNNNQCELVEQQEEDKMTKNKNVNGKNLNTRNSFSPADYNVGKYANRPLNNKRSSLNFCNSISIPSLITEEITNFSNETKSQPTKSILRNPSIKKQSSLRDLHYGLPPDQTYPNEYRADYSSDSDDEDEKPVEYASVKKSKKLEQHDKFSHSYSAGDICPKLPPKTMIFQSEMNLNQYEQQKQQQQGYQREKRSLFQRFRTALTKAFSSEKPQNNLNNNDNKNLNNKIENSLHRSPSKIFKQKLDINSNSPKSSPVRSNFNSHGLSKSPSFIKSFRTRISIRRKDVRVNVEKNSPEKKLRWKDQPLKTLPETRKDPTKDELVWGELIKINSDGSQVVIIHRQQGKPFGFFVAKGTVNNTKGVFVSRMRNEETQKSLTGVLEIGDEILRIDGEYVKDSNIMHINELIANKDKIQLTVKPYTNQKYL